MAKKLKVTKAQAVRDYLNAHPGAKPLEIVAALTEQGVQITRSHVGNIKTKLNQEAAPRKAAKKVAKKKVVVDVTAPAVVEKPSNGGTITLDQIKLVAHAIKSLGGFHRVVEVLEVIKEMGGVKKFRDLAEAISVTESATDDIPF